MIEQIEWVPVAERLPDEDGMPVLLFVPVRGGQTWPGWWIGHAWLGTDGTPVMCEVTHWSPMPAGPRG